MKIESLLNWAGPKRVNTKNGERDLFKAEATAEFWELWRDQKTKAYLQNAGISVSRPQGSTLWEVCWWKQIPKEEIEAKKAQLEASRASGLDVQLPVPAGLDYLPYQKAGINFALSAFKLGNGVLIADEMGLGKTIQAVGTINCDEKIQRVLVICPATLKINWYRELKKWLTRPLNIGIADSKTFPTTDVVIINYDILHKYPKSLEFFWDLIVLDEGHVLKNRKARRTQCVLGYRPSKKEQNQNPPVQPKAPMNARRKVVMTGSPIMNEPMDIFPIINWLDPKNWGNWFQFAKRYCGMQDGQFGKIFTATNLDELNRKLRETVMVRRLKSEVLTELPPKRRQIIQLEPPAHVLSAERKLDKLDEEAQEIAAQLELAKASTESWEEYQAQAATVKSRTVAFTEISRVRHETALAKVPDALEFTDDIVAEKKVIIFAHHRDVIDLTAAHYGNAAVKIMGGMKPEEKQAAVDRFQNDPTCKVAVCSIQAAGVGITLTAADTVVFFELDWVPGIVMQCEDRAHRIGQKNSVNIIHLVYSGTLDGRMVEVVLDKQLMIEKALDAKVSAKEFKAIAEEAVVPSKAKLETVSFAKVEKQAEKISKRQRDAIHAGLKLLARVCDGAAALDSHGFNKFDSTIGKSLADAPVLSAKQAVLGQRLVIKYSRQLPANIVELAKEEQVAA